MRYLGLILACALLGLAAAPAVAQAGATGSVTVLVTQANHAPLAGAMVTLNGPTLTQSDYTGADGKATFSNLPVPMSFTVRVDRPGFRSVTRQGRVTPGRFLLLQFQMSQESTKK